MLHQRIARDEILRQAETSDLGFSRETLATSLRMHARLDDDEFPDMGVEISSIRDYFNEWANQLENS